MARSIAMNNTSHIPISQIDVKYKTTISQIYDKDISLLSLIYSCLIFKMYLSGRKALAAPAIPLASHRQNKTNQTIGFYLPLCIFASVRYYFRLYDD